MSALGRERSLPGRTAVIFTASSHRRLDAIGRCGKTPRQAQAVLDSQATAVDAERLSAQQLGSFADRGFVVVPSFLPPDDVSALRREVDIWLDEGLRAESIVCCVGGSRRPPPTMELELPHHGALVSYPR